MCSCGEVQTVDHVLFKSGKCGTERDKLKETILKRGQSWPICKNDFISRHRKAFIKLEEKVKMEDKEKGIKFELETEEKGKITFSDVKLKRNKEDGKIQTE